MTQFGPDELFSALQRERLERLMSAWRAARDGGQSLTVEDQAELERLVDAEIEAATTRAVRRAN